MSKSIKFKNNQYLDSSSITHSRKSLSSILNNLVTGSNPVAYHPGDLSSMSSGNTSAIIDVSKTYIFNTDWTNYSSYDSRFSGVIGIYIKGFGASSSGGVAIIFFYSGAIGINIRIDNNRWGGWKWL